MGAITVRYGGIRLNSKVLKQMVDDKDIRSVGIIYTVIDCKFYVHIDCNATHIILHHYIATSHSITTTRHAK